jgi:hypothetical protein
MRLGVCMKIINTQLLNKTICKHKIIKYLSQIQKVPNVLSNWQRRNQKL